MSDNIQEQRQEAQRSRLALQIRLGSFEYFFELLFKTIGGILLSFVRELAPFVAPIAPASFFSMAVYAGVLPRAAEMMSQQTAVNLATTVAIVAALSLESAGVMSAHYAIKLKAKRDQQWGLAAGLALAYLAIGIATILFLENAPFDIKAVGVAMFLIAFIVYAVVGLAETEKATASQERETAVSTASQEREALAYERKLKEEQAQRAHGLKLAEMRIEADRASQEQERKTRISLARVRAKGSGPAPLIVRRRQPVPERIAALPLANGSSGNGSHHAKVRAKASETKGGSAFACGSCGNPYASQNGLNAHRRHCKGKA